MGFVIEEMVRWQKELRAGLSRAIVFSLAFLVGWGFGGWVAVVLLVRLCARRHSPRKNK